MTLTLPQSKIIKDLATLLYPFLPGNPHPYADQRISFKGIAEEMGLRSFWPAGSKQPAITTLLENTYDFKKDLFCNLILEIVRRGMKYSEITKEEIVLLNDLVQKLEFKVPELWDPDFLNSLPSEEAKQTENIDSEENNKQKLKYMVDKLLEIAEIEGPSRGFAFEKYLNELFELFDLEPNNSFRLIGEQIDGSIQLDGQTYLVEAKWHNKQIDGAELYAFKGKIDGKASWSRGLFISYSGFTENALDAFSRLGPTNIICMDAQDLYFILDGKISLIEVIKQKARKAAETGKIFVKVYEL